MSDTNNYGKPLLSMNNHHVEGCGVPPHVTDKSGQYIGYFENQYGEQAVFVFDRAAQTGTLYMGDAGWEESYKVVKGWVPGLVMNAGERTWLRTCWEAATGTKLAPDIPENFIRLGAGG